MRYFTTKKVKYAWDDETAQFTKLRYVRDSLSLLVDYCFLGNLVD